MEYIRVRNKYGQKVGVSAQCGFYFVNGVNANRLSVDLYEGRVLAEGQIPSIPTSVTKYHRAPHLASSLQAVSLVVELSEYVRLSQ